MISYDYEHAFVYNYGVGCVLVFYICGKCVINVQFPNFFSAIIDKRAFGTYTLHYEFLYDYTSGGRKLIQDFNHVPASLTVELAGMYAFTLSFCPYNQQDSKVQICRNNDVVSSQNVTVQTATCVYMQSLAQVSAGDHLSVYVDTLRPFAEYRYTYISFNYTGNATLNAALVHA